MQQKHDAEMSVLWVVAGLLKLEKYDTYDTPVKTLPT